MTPARMAAIHAAAFAGRGQVWSEADITALRARPVIDTVAAGDDGFAVLQIVPPEAEILTIAIAPDRQGQGVGRVLIQAALAHAARAGAHTLFLEVAEDNARARALYARTGFCETGRRRGYYARDPGPAVDALILGRSLAAEKTGAP